MAYRDTLPFRTFDNFNWSFHSNNFTIMVLAQQKCISSYDYQITIHPNRKNNYWRFGIKLSEQFNISLDRISLNNPLLHVTQSFPHILSINYYDENNIPWSRGEHPLDNNYNFEKLKIFISSDLHKLTIKILKNERTIFTEQYNVKYTFAKILAWGDGNDYKIDCKVKRIPKKLD